MLAVDYSNASSLALLDPRTRAWSDRVLDASGVDAGDAARARGRDPAGRAGRPPPSPRPPGLSPDTVVVVGCGDEMAATLGAGVYAPGEVCDVVGHRRARLRGLRRAPATTRPCWSSATRTPTRTSGCWRTPGFVSGGNLRWWRDQFAAGRAGRRGQRRGRRVRPAHPARPRRCPPGAEGLVFLPCMQGAMAPEWNGAARGVFYGLTLAHTRAHMPRARCWRGAPSPCATSWRRCGAPAWRSGA